MSKGSSVASGLKGYVRTHMADLRPLLDLEEPFTIKDMPWGFDKSSSVLRSMNHADILHRAGKDYTTGEKETDYIWEWAINPDAREYAEQRSAQYDTLPCGHRGHIHNKGDTYGCRYCDEDRDYSKEVVEATL